MAKLLIYCGEGTARELIDDFKRCCTLLHLPLPREVTAPDVIQGRCFNGAAALVIPGGRDLPYCAALNGKGNQRINDFVHAGGGYLGVCAGAYYASRRLSFDAGLASEVSGERELGFFPGEAVGPAFGPGTYDYNSRSGARAAELRLQDGRAGITYFNGGCYFRADPGSSGVRVLAHYSQIEGTPPAVVAMQHGSGTALLSGVHPEFDIHRLERSNPAEKALFQQLRPSVDFSLALIDLFFSELGLK